jgi:guanine nucleotide-binding protein G(i) subunit alpha
MTPQASEIGVSCVFAAAWALIWTCFAPARSYFAKVAEIAAPGYLPSVEDVLRSRVRTSGIVEEIYNISGVDFAIYDVGGQRNERKKWIHCFDGVTAVIFVASLSEYDQVLYEDHSVNRMVRATQICCILRS